MHIHIGNGVGAMSPERIGGLQGRFMAALSARMLVGFDKKMASIAAKKKPAAKAKAALKPVAVRKPMSRAARLRQAESEVKAMQPRDPRCCWADMTPA